METWLYVPSFTIPPLQLISRSTQSNLSKNYNYNMYKYIYVERNEFKIYKAPLLIVYNIIL